LALEKFQTDRVSDALNCAQVRVAWVSFFQ